MQLIKFFARYFLYLVSIVEVPIFLWRNRAIFNNKTIYTLWHWSFGHSVSRMDYASRLFYPNRISMVYVPHKGSNRFLTRIFKHNIDAFIFENFLKIESHFLSETYYRIIRFWLNLMAGITDRVEVISSKTIYDTVSLAQGGLMVGREEESKADPVEDYTGYVRLLHENIGHSPALPPELQKKCEDEIKIKHPEFYDRPFVTILLREKGREEGKSLDDSFRCAGAHANYLPAVRFLTEQGYHVVGTGETEVEIFKDVSGFYSLNDVNLDYKLLNLYLLMNAKLFIGQQSGPHILPNSCGVLCLICDAMPYRIGTFKEEDIILWKHLIDGNTGEEIDFIDVYKKHEDLALGYNFKNKKIQIHPNSPEEILEATKEVVKILKGQVELTEERKHLIRAFRQLPNQKMTLRVHRNRTSMHLLEKHKDKLLEMNK